MVWGPLSLHYRVVDVTNDCVWEGARMGSEEGVLLDAGGRSEEEGVSRECPLNTDTPGRSGGGGCRLFNFGTSDSDWRLAIGVLGIRTQHRKAHEY